MRARILNASAGSGKTYQLAYKYVRDAVEQPQRYRHILAVTFTNKATEEMKSRILREIHTLASGAQSPFMESLQGELSLDEQTIRERAKRVRSYILHDYSRFTILTIDKFFQRILRAFVKELGVDLNYNLELDNAPVLMRGVDALVEQIADDPQLQRWIVEFSQESIEDGKKWDIREAILALGGELFKESNRDNLSNPRTKEQIKELVDKTLVRVKQTKGQMRELAQRGVDIMKAAGVTNQDFTGKSRSFINYFAKIASGSTDKYTATVSKYRDTLDGWCPKASPAVGLVGELQPLLQQICDIQDENRKEWITAELIGENYRSFALLTDLYEKVQQMCREESLMLLSQTKHILSEFIAENDAPFIYEKVGNRFERFMIDEFQDTSTQEWSNFVPLLQNAMSQTQEGQTSVVLVGDIKQSIYRWRGGDWRILHSDAREQLGSDEIEVINLKSNYRSLPTVVQFNNSIIEAVVERDNQQLNEMLEQAFVERTLRKDVYESLRDTLKSAYVEHSQEPKKVKRSSGYVSIETFDEEPPLIDRIKSIIDRGFKPKDIMILVRGAKDGMAVAAELLRFKSENSDPRYRFDVMTHEALIIGNAPVCSFIAAAMSLSLNMNVAINRALFNQYLEIAYDQELDEQNTIFLRSLRLLSPEEAFEQIVMRYSLGDNSRQIAYLQAMQELILGFCSNRVADIALFLKWWGEVGSMRSLSVEQSETTIEITTVHKSKGLEKKVVIIPHCNWALGPMSSGVRQNFVWSDANGSEFGGFPIKLKKSMAESEFSSEYFREVVYSHVDNVNLLYVALTRAVEALYVFIPVNKKTSVGALLLGCLGREGESARIGELTGRYRQGEGFEHYEFGELASPVDSHEGEESIKHITLERFRSGQADLRLRLPSQRYFEEDAVELSPRNLGVLMHRAFERAQTQEDIFSALEYMHTDSAITQKEFDLLCEMVERAMSNDVVAHWFDGSWDAIRNENEIIIPGLSTSRRPDRVMIKGNRAVVVDYKFGSAERESHTKQLQEYSSLLLNMGYSSVEGYLWYVKLGRVVKI